MLKLDYTIRIAIAGKRKHENLSFLETDGRIEKILSVLNGLHNSMGQGDMLRVQFLTGLAVGADQVVTEKVFNYPYVNKNGEILKPNVDAILPFSVEKYIKHPLYPFPKENYDAFDNLLKKCDRIICANSDVVSERICKEDFSHLSEATNRAYEAQALLMLRRCDVLIAIADPGDKIIPAGTLHTINRARAYHIPVIFLSLSDVRIYVFDDERIFYETVDILIKKYKDHTDEVKVLYELFNKLKNSQKPEYGKGETLDYEQLLSENKYKEAKINTKLKCIRHSIWDYINTKLTDEYLKENGKEVKKGNNILICKIYFSFKEHYKIKKNIKKSKIIKPIPIEKEVINHESLGVIYKNLENINTFFSYQYRGGFILNNFFAILAVTLAISALGFLVFEDDFEILALGIILIVLAVFKFFTLKGIEKNTHTVQSENWNEKGIKSRYLAERLRVFKYLYANDILRGIKPLMGKHLDHTFKGAPLEAIYRKIEGNISFLPNANNQKFYFLDPIKNLEILNKDLIQGQIAYHTKTSRKMQIMEKFLEKRGEMLNKVTIGLVVIDIVILFFSVFKELFFENCFPCIELLHKYVTPFFIGITALFPALVAAFNAVRFQSEARKLKERYAAMRDLLTEKSKNIDKILAESYIDNKGSDIIEFFPLIAEIEQIMLDEVADWSLLYSKEFPET